MTTDQIQDYTRKITNGSPTDIIVVLYELAIKYIDDAVDANKAANHEVFRKECSNAQKVLGDLVGALNFDYELAFALYRIYEYIEKEIANSVIKDDATSLANCRKFLLALKDSFEKVSKEDNNGPMMDNAQTVYAGLTYGKGTLNESVSQGASTRGFTV